VIKQTGNWWIGWIEEVPGVNCQEATREELLETLRVTLREALEFNRHEALAAAGGTTPSRTSDPPSPDTTRSTTAWLGRSARIWAFPL
jgi:predicted RNase H-like HicB family nuclease